MCLIIWKPTKFSATVLTTRRLTPFTPPLRVSTFLKVAFVVHRGIREGFFCPQPPLRSPENKSESTSNGSPTRTSLSDGKDLIFSSASNLTHSISDGTFIPNNVNAGGSAVLIRKNLLPENVVVTHEITCQGRDHIVRIRSGESFLVVINVHLEPDLILRRFWDAHWGLQQLRA